MSERPVPDEIHRTATQETEKATESEQIQGPEFTKEQHEQQITEIKAIIVGLEEMPEDIRDEEDQEQLEWQKEVLAELEEGRRARQ